MTISISWWGCGSKPVPGADLVVVPHPQAAEAHALGVVVVAEAEVMVRIQPFVAEAAEPGEGTNLDHGDLLCYSFDIERFGAEVVSPIAGQGALSSGSPARGGHAELAQQPAELGAVHRPLRASHRVRDIGGVCSEQRLDEPCARPWSAPPGPPADRSVWRVRRTRPRASSLSTRSVMLPGLVSTLRPSSRWLSGPLCRIASSTPNCVTVSPAAASRGSTRAKHRPACAQQLHIGAQRLDHARIVHAERPAAIRSPHAVADGSAVHHHRQRGVLQHVPRHAAEDELAQARMRVGAHRQQVAAEVARRRQQPGADASCRPSGTSRSRPGRRAARGRPRDPARRARAAGSRRPTACAPPRRAAARAARPRPPTRDSAVPFQARQIAGADRRRRDLRRDQHRAAGIEQHRVQRVGGGHVLARLRMRHHGQVGEARLLRDQILLAPGDGGEAGGGASAPGRASDSDHVVLARRSGRTSSGRHARGRCSPSRWPTSSPRSSRRTGPRRPAARRRG